MKPPNRFWLPALLLLALAWPSLALAETCTPAQREAADRQLWLNGRDRDLATATVFPWGAPATPDDPSRRRLVQRDYVIAYDDDLQGPVWAANVLGLKPLTGGRIDCFRKDPRMPSAVASRPSDYDEPIFDQGHMVPNADMGFGDIPIMNSFIMSNMTPQFCQFNRGIWQILETLVRFWARDGSPVYVLNGAVFDQDGDGAWDADADAVRMRSRTGRTRVSVPSAYFKVLARPRPDGGVQTLTILLPHTQLDVDGETAIDYLRAHVTRLAPLEQVLGSDLFPALSAPPLSRTASSGTSRARDSGAWSRRPVDARPAQSSQREPRRYSPCPNP
ncbi:MAG: DNA/RNA non-specific endonuclease [Brevundimonas sp.]